VNWGRSISVQKLIKGGLISRRSSIFCYQKQKRRYYNLSVCQSKYAEYRVVTDSPSEIWKHFPIRTSQKQTKSHEEYLPQNGDPQRPQSRDGQPTETESDVTRSVPPTLTCQHPPPLSARQSLSSPTSNDIPPCGIFAVYTVGRFRRIVDMIYRSADATFWRGGVNLGREVLNNFKAEDGCVY